MMRMEILGGDQVAKVLRDLPLRTSKSVMRKALISVAGEPIRREISQRAPREPGAPDLAEHIGISSSPAKGASVAVKVGPTVEARSDQPGRTFDLQGFFVEYGTSDTQAQPFMRPAFSAVAFKVIGGFVSEIWSALISKGFGSGRGSSSGGGLT